VALVFIEFVSSWFVSHDTPVDLSFLFNIKGCVPNKGVSESILGADETLLVLFVGSEGAE
jgi:hypothetical protein